MSFVKQYRVGSFLLGTLMAGMTFIWLDSSTASAQLTPYSQNFESLDATSSSALGDDGWIVGGIVTTKDFSSSYYGTGSFLYQYFDGAPAPNDGSAFSNITVTADADPPQGNQGLVIYSDYNNGDHNDPTRRIESIFYREQTVTAQDVGKTAKFSFVAQDDNLGADSLASAFIKTLDPSNSFSLTSHLAVETTSLPTVAGGTEYSISLPITPNLVGNVFQIGFDNWADNFAASGVDYDNLDLSFNDTFGSYSEDFESATTANSLNSLSLNRSGWKAFGTVSNSNEILKFSYGPFGAPNNPTPSTSAGFSSVASAEGGANQGTQALSTYSDYNCCTDNGPEGHANGTDIVDSSIFREVIVGSQDDGRQVEFKFDAKIPSSSAIAFDSNNASAEFYIRSIDANSGTVIAEAIVDAASLGLNSSTWQTGSVLFDITSAHVGNLLQFGINNQSSNNAGTEILLDNISLADAVSTPGDFDTDGDVDGNDFLTWQRIDGTPEGLDEWSGAYSGSLSAIGGLTAVPEPSTALLSLLAVASLALKRRK